MRSSCFRRLFENEAGRVFSLAGRARRSFGVEDIHDLRVEVKRLRALLGVVKACSPKVKTRRFLRAFRRLFKAAAGLREAQVSLGLARDWTASSALGLDEYRNALKQDELAGRKVFAAEAKRFREDFSPGDGRTIDEAVGDLRVDELERTAAERLNNLNKRLFGLKKPQPAKRHLHRIRVQAKKTRYTLEILRECFRPDDARLAGLNGALRSVHQALGRWHDLELAAGSLRDFLGRRAERPLRNPSAYEGYDRFLVSEQTKRLAEFEEAWVKLDRVIASYRP